MKGVRESLQRIGGRILPGAQGFFGWWRLSLAAWLPARWQKLLEWSRARLMLSQADGELHAQLDEGGAIREVARLPWPLSPAQLDAVLAPRLAALPRWLLLPASLGLRRRMRLPAAAEERLRDVIGFEIDRQTPFQAADVYFDAHRIGPPEAGQLQVELVVVPKRNFDGIWEDMAGWHADLSGVEIADDAGRPMGVNLLPPAQRRRRNDPARRWSLLLAGIALVAVVGAGAQILHNRRAAADAFEQRVASDAIRARAVALQRQKYVDLVEGTAFLQQLRVARPTAVEVWDELSRRLPDGTYLEKFSVEGDRMMLVGFSAEASSLVGKLEGSPLWRSPALTGVLQSDATTGRDRFTLSATLSARPAPQAKPEAADAGIAK